MKNGVNYSGSYNLTDDEKSELIYELNNNPPPSYWNTHLNERIADIRERLRSTTDLDAFVFVTDVHVPNNVMNGHKLAEQVFKHTSVKKMFCGGDIPGLRGDINTLYDVADKYWNTYGKACVDNGVSHYMTRGNHDWHVDGYSMDNNGVYDLSSRRQENDVEAPNNRNYYYVDNNRMKIRYIVLDTSEIFIPASGTHGNLYSYGCYQEQVTWFAETLKNTPSGYHILVIGHIPVATSLSSEHEVNLQIFADMFSAYKNRSHFVASGEQYGVYYDGAYQFYLTCDVDFTDCEAILVGYLYGHEHLDARNIVGGVNHITCGADALYNDDPNVQRVANTTSESLITVFVIDKTERKLYGIRIGAGDSFSVSY